MQKTYIALCLLLMPLCGIAQSFSLGFNAGIAPSTGRNGFSLNNVKYTMITHPAASLRFVADYKGWQAGIQVEGGAISHKKSTELSPLYFYNALGGIYNIGADAITYTVKEVFADLHVTPLLFINKKIKIGTSFLYAGPAAGYMFTFVKEGPLYNGGNLNLLAPVKHPSTSGITLGLQAGYTIDLNKKLAANAEVAYRFANVTYRTEAFYGDDYIVPETETKYTLSYIPITIGIRYKL